MSVSATDIAARLERLPFAAPVRRWVLLISLGFAFEIYDLFLTAYLVPGLAKAGYFAPASLGSLQALDTIGIRGAATFVFASFAGLFVGSIGLGTIADRRGRRAVFTFSMIAYSLCTAVMAAQRSGFGIVLWRFLAGIGMGVELVTIDAYVCELVPGSVRGRAFAFSQFVGFCMIPLVAFTAWALIPREPFGIAGWRWVVALGSLGAIAAWFLRRGLPESPRWLARQGRFEEAARVTAALEQAVEAVSGPLPAPSALPPESGGTDRFGELWQAPYRRRTIALSVFNFFQTFGYYGFAAWVPTLLIARGISVTTSLGYSFLMALANPIGPLAGLALADRIERKWQICTAALAVGGFGLAFARQSSAPLLILFGALVTLANNWMSFAFHGYQAEVFPTRIRARAVGFVYGWSRLSAALSGPLIAWLLARGGTRAVFTFIALAMLIVIASIGVFGPRSRGLSLESIAERA